MYSLPFLDSRIAGVKIYRPPSSLIEQAQIAESSDGIPAVNLHPAFNGFFGWFPTTMFEQVFGDAPTFESVGYKITNEVTAPKGDVIVYLELSGEAPTHKVKPAHAVAMIRPDNIVRITEVSDARASQPPATLPSS